MLPTPVRIFRRVLLGCALACTLLATVSCQGGGQDAQTEQAKQLQSELISLEKQFKEKLAQQRATADSAGLIALQDVETRFNAWHDQVAQIPGMEHSHEHDHSDHDHSDHDHHHHHAPANPLTPQQLVEVQQELKKQIEALIGEL